MAIGGLVVSVATLAWTVVNDLRTKMTKPSSEVVARRVRLKIETPDGVTPTQRDRIIDVVVHEALSAPPPDLPNE